MTQTLTGIGNSPIPRVAREFKFAQGTSIGAGSGDEVVLVGNMTSAGTATADALAPTPIQSQADIDQRAGARSELRWMYYAYNLVDQNATIKFVPVTESGGSAASVQFTFTTTADDISTIAVEWGGLQLQVPVAIGDTAITQCAAVVAKINADPNMPFTAAQGSSPNDHKMTVTAANKGPRSTQIMNALRVRYLSTMASSVSKGSVSAGATDDDFTNALAALSNTEIRYHVPACTANTTVTSTDNGVGEYIQFLRMQASPSNGKNQIGIFGLNCSQSQGTAVAISSAANSVYAKFYRVENNDMCSPMIAAIHAAVNALEQRSYAAANLAGYTTTDSTTYPIPDPFDKADRPTVTEMTADLNNGVSTVGFYPSGQAYLVRDITSYNWTGSSSTKDYRSREGHITIVTFKAWEELEARYIAQKQPNVAADPPQGVRPIQGFTYPGTIKGLAFSVITDMAGPFQNGKALLDPSVIDEMKGSVSVELGAAGFFTAVTFQPVRHNLFSDFLVQQAGPAY